MNYTFQFVNKILARESTNGHPSLKEQVRPFVSKVGQNATCEETDGWNGCLFPPRVGNPILMLSYFRSTCPYLYIELEYK